MSRVSKIVGNNIIKPALTKAHKVKKPIVSNNNVNSRNLLSKSLLCLSMLGAVTLKSCEPMDPIDNEFNTEIDDSIVLVNQIDDIMKALGLFIEPNNSIKEVGTLSFNSDKKEQFFFKFDYIDDKSVSVKQIKYDSKLSRGDSRITFFPSDSGFEVVKMTGYFVQNMKIIPEDKSLKCYILEDGNWKEHSILKNTDGVLVQKNQDGSVVKYFDIKNNEYFPEDIYFEQPEEYDDEIVFG